MRPWLMSLIHMFWTPRDHIENLTAELERVKEKQEKASKSVNDASKQAVARSYHTIRAAQAAMAIVAGNR